MTRRLFFALETPAPVRASLEEVIRELRQSGADVRWEPPGKFHCTIRFLGDTEERRIPSLTEEARKVAAFLPPPSVEFAGLGAFPDSRQPRVLWAGMIEPAGVLGRLRAGLDEAIVRLGLPGDERGFHPHLTIGRVRGNRRLFDLITAMESATFGCAPVVLRELLLMQSELRPTGSVYTTLHAFPFSANSA